MIINNKPSFKYAITDNKKIIKYLENKILPENMPILFTIIECLKKDLEKRGYSEEQIEQILNKINNYQNRLF